MRGQGHSEKIGFKLQMECVVELLGLCHNAQILICNNTERMISLRLRRLILILPARSLLSCGDWLNHG